MADTGRVQNNWREFSLEPISPPSILDPSIVPHVIVIPSFTRPRYMICAAGHTLYSAPPDLASAVDVDVLSDLAGHFYRVTTRCYLYITTGFFETVGLSSLENCGLHNSLALSQL